MRLITNRTLNGHVSLDTINEFEKEILSDTNVIPTGPKNRFLVNFLYYIYIVSKKIGIPTYKYFEEIYAFFIKSKSSHFFTVMMGLDSKKGLPYFFIPKQNKSIYLFDAWQNTHDQIKHFVDFFNIGSIYVSSKLATESLKLKLKKSNIYWIPEGVNSDEYKYYAYEEKTIDVLALGRKYDNYHNLIVKYLETRNKVYLYEKAKGEIIFPTRKEFIEGLGRSKISICVPSSITHPDRTGGIQTMTIRYLQSMVSKCLVLGNAPAEMIELFGYNPVVEIDMLRPHEQLSSILDNFNDYIPLIEKNYQMVIIYHTWKCRWNQIKEIMIS